MDQATIDLLEIPPVLDRRNDTPEHQRQHLERLQRNEERERKATANARKKREREIEAARLLREEKAQAKADRRKAKADQKARSAQRKQDRQAIPYLLQSGAITIGQMSKASGIPRARLKPALRYLLKKGTIQKNTPRTYKLIAGWI